MRAEIIYNAGHRLKAVLPSFFFLALFFTLFTFPVSMAFAFTYGGSYVPIVSLIISGLKSQALPPTWVLVSTPPHDSLEISLLSSVTFALVIGSPLIFYATFHRLLAVRFGEGRRKNRTVYLFTLAASVAFGIGALFAYFFFDRYFFQVMSLYLVGVSLSTPVPVIPLVFYSNALAVLAITAILFALPIHVAAAILFRRQRNSRSDN